MKVCEILNGTQSHMTQEGDTKQSWKTDQLEENTENLSRDINNNQIQLNSMEFNEDQWMSFDINRNRSILAEFNRFQSISTDIIKD